MRGFTRAKLFCAAHNPNIPEIVLQTDRTHATHRHNKRRRSKAEPNYCQPVRMQRLLGDWRAMKANLRRKCKRTHTTSAAASTAAATATIRRSLLCEFMIIDI